MSLPVAINLSYLSLTYSSSIERLGRSYCFGADTITKLVFLGGLVSLSLHIHPVGHNWKSASALQDSMMKSLESQLEKVKLKNAAMWEGQWKRIAKVQKFLHDNCKLLQQMIQIILIHLSSHVLELLNEWFQSCHQLTDNSNTGCSHTSKCCCTSISNSE